jgi:serine/threonine-protein kinase
MGSVYEAEHLRLRTRVAIKVLHPELMRRSGLVERFLQEATVSAQIKSPHVVQVLDVDQLQGGPAYIVMELLQGEPLSRVLEREGKVAPPLACNYTRQILEALEAAHALNVVHRDLKPENVFVTIQQGAPVLKLIDFGIAKLRGADTKNLTVAGMLMGTAEYMAPEQAFSADRADVRSDIYAVGVMLYEMLSGTRPLTGDDARLIALRVDRGDQTPLRSVAPFIAPELAELVHRAIAPKPEQRFANATEMRMALDRWASGDRGAPAADAGAFGPAQPTTTGTMMGAPVPAALLGAPVAVGAPGLAGGPAPMAAHGAMAGAVAGPKGATMMGSAGGSMGAAGPIRFDTPLPPPPPGAMGPMPAMPAAYAPRPSTTTASGRRKKGGAGIWIIALVALLLGGAGVGAVLVLQQESTSTTPPSPVPPALTSAPSSVASHAPGTSDTAPPLAQLNNGTTNPVQSAPNTKPQGTSGGPAPPKPTTTAAPDPTPTTPIMPPIVVPTNLGIPTVLPTTLPTVWPFPPPSPPP